MAFDLIDKFTAIDLNINFASWQVAIEENLCRPPGAWFAFNMGICFFMCWCLNKLMAYLADKARIPFDSKLGLKFARILAHLRRDFGGQTLNFLTFEVVLNREIDPGALKKFLATRQVRFNSILIRFNSTLIRH